MAESRPIFTAAVCSRLYRSNGLTADVIICSVGKQSSVLIRGLGPSLASFGIPAPLANPTLYLFDHTGALIAANDNWKDTQQTQIQATGLAPPNNLEAAILVTLSPGAYTVFLQGKAMTTGIGLDGSLRC